ncbi:MAG: S41 family peptidase [Acidimicrobiales bacterium]|nr:S41 family peptidase [Hyphomonadaceae bacterium]RZV40307.1 MAG: S41 family peptidase [Acidimicrobiales bacterium]
MKYILPTIGVVAASALFAFSTTNQNAIAVEKSSHEQTFEQLDLFADVLARVRNDYVVPVDNGELIDDAINGMLQALDPHSSYVSPDRFEDLQVSTSGEYGGLGMEVTMEDGVVKVVAPIDETPAKKAGIKSGDYLTAIDGESILGLSLNEAVDNMRGKPGEPITVTVVRKGEDPLDITMTREIIKRIVVRHRVEDGFGYLRISQFNEKTMDSLEASVKALKKELGGRIPGVILDLRGNPGGLLDQSIKVSSAFLDGGEVVSTRGRHTADTERYNAQRGELLKGIPVVVLIDGASASASEIVAGAIQDRGRGLLIGMTSFGKGSVQSVIPLRNGRDGALRLTTARYYTPSGRSIQGTGITPDIAISYALDDGEGNENGGIRESDLPNSILNEKEKLEAENGDAEEELSVEYPPEGFDVEDDFQLQRALEILKTGSYTQLLASAKG